MKPIVFGKKKYGQYPPKRSKPMYERTEGKIIATVVPLYDYTPVPNETAARLLQFEMWLNSEVSAMAMDKFGIGVRVHLQYEPKEAS